jgi:hypothetical protein
MRKRFSTPSGKVRLKALYQVSLIITSPTLALGLRVALTGLERVTLKNSLLSLVLSLRMGMLSVAKELLGAIVKVPVLVV